MAPSNDNHERTPLILRQHSPEALPTGKDSRKGPNTVIFLLALWVACSGCSDELVQPPQVRVLESIYCRTFYAGDTSVIGPDGNISEELCKGPWIQQQVATLKGWQLFFESVPALLLAIPFGWFADQRGRKPLIVMLSVAFFARAIWIQFVFWVWPLVPIRLVWLSALHSFFGGSNPVASAIIFVMISDVTKNTDRAQAFGYVASSVYATQFLAPPLSALLMKQDPWIPMLLGLFLQFLCIPIVALIPETLDYFKIQQDHNVEPLQPPPTKQPWITKLYLALRSFIQMVTADTRVPALLATFLVHTVIIASNVIMLQYLSTRYNLTIATSTLIISIRSASVVIVLLFLPTLSRRLSSYTTLSAFRQDVLVARASALITSIAYIAISLSPSAVVCVMSLLLSTTGSGMFIVLRSILLALVAENDAAKILSATSVIDTLGLMVGGPSMAALFGQGLQMGRKWMGLPFLGCAVCVGLVAVLLFSIDAEHSTQEDQGAVDEEDHE